MSKNFEGQPEEIKEPHLDDMGVLLTPEEVEAERNRRENEGWRDQR